MNPRVTFVVPCYKLAHLLRECVESILSQSYQDFEVLIMDDCSPDNTSEVAHTFQDARVKYVRNEVNIGHLRNYNKGVGLAIGKYVWLISADDRLRKPYALERYVNFIEAHPKMGFVFCPAIGLQDGLETEMVSVTYCGEQEAVFNGRDFLVHSLLRKGGGIAAPTVMARKECYEKVCWFPLDMPHQGDAYLWSMWALHYDVGYLPQPMVHYRLHNLSMMATFAREDPSILLNDELSVLWRLKLELQKRRLSSAVLSVERYIVAKYVYALGNEYYPEKACVRRMTFEQCERSIYHNSESLKEATRIRAHARAGLADHCVWHGDLSMGRDLYLRSLCEYVWMPKAAVQYLLLHFGEIGDYLRRMLGAIRRKTVGDKGGTSRFDGYSGGSS